MCHRIDVVFVMPPPSQMSILGQIRLAGIHSNAGKPWPHGPAQLAWLAWLARPGLAWPARPAQAGRGQPGLAGPARLGWPVMAGWRWPDPHSVRSNSNQTQGLILNPGHRINYVLQIAVHIENIMKHGRHPLDVCTPFRVWQNWRYTGCKFLG